MVHHKPRTANNDAADSERRVHHFSLGLRILAINAGIFSVNSSIFIGYLGGWYHFCYFILNVIMTCTKCM